MSRSIIRPVAQSDAGELIAANRTSAELHRPWVHPFTDAVGFEAYFATLREDQKVGLLARKAETGKAAGLFNLSQIARGNFQSAYLGFYGFSGQVGRGLMTEALRAVLDFAFGELGLHRIEANVQPGNARSIALLDRVGFRKEGFSPRYLSIYGAWRDHERWAILADEFEY
jgi:ribosomal-protein-alanine N-acetyltransferase